MLDTANSLNSISLDSPATLEHPARTEWTANNRLRFVGATATASKRRDRIARRLRQLRATQLSLKSTQKRLLHELRLAESVQRSLLPTSFPRLPGIDFGYAYLPLNHMAGDFYNVFRLDRDHLGLFVGDVMGHGPAAALLTVLAMHTIRTKKIEGHSYQILPPSQVLADLSQKLIEARLPSEPFLTLAYGVLNLQSLVLTYCTGGHPPPLLLRGELAPISMNENGPLLGVVEVPFSDSDVQLLQGDRLLFYSDGALSARWGAHGSGELALAATLKPRSPLLVQQQLDLAASDCSFDDAHLEDDITILALDLTAPAAA